MLTEGALLSPLSSLVLDMIEWLNAGWEELFLDYMASFKIEG